MIPSILHGTDAHSTKLPKETTRGYIWVAYSKKPPYLPIAAADSAEDLAKKCGTSKSNILSIWCRFRHGQLPSSRFYRVKAEDTGLIPEEKV